ncbi:MAG: ParA family protein, partial [Methylococcales bacterium]
VVVTRYDGRRKLSGAIYKNLKQFFGDELCTTRIVENVSLAESPSQSKDVFAYAPHSPGARDYRALAQELVACGFFS